MLYLLIASNISMIALYILKFNQLPPQIPLFYSKPWGEDQLADSWMIIILPIMMNVFYFVNNFILKKFFPDNPFVANIIKYVNMAIVISSTLIFIRIIFLIS